MLTDQESCSSKSVLSLVTNLREILLSSFVEDIIGFRTLCCSKCLQLIASRLFIDYSLKACMHCLHFFLSSPEVEELINLPCSFVYCCKQNFNVRGSHQSFIIG